MKRLKTHETRLVGNFRIIGDRVVADEVCERVDQLVDNYLQHIKTHESGWDTLFKDPNDGRYWELTYLQSEMHGGGPRSLICISAEAAKQKYDLAD